MDRLNAQLQRVISEIITYKVKDPRVSGMVSVLEVDCTKDLKLAKVLVSIFNEDDDKIQETFDALVRCTGFIRKELSFAFKDIRCIPDLKFTLDNSMKYGAKIDKILQQIKDR